MRGWLAALAIVAFAMLVASWAVRVAEGRRSMLESDAAVARGDALEAILAARAAAEARCPFCTAPDRGFQRLEAIAKEAESRGDEWTAFASFRAMCAASIATTAHRHDRAAREMARLGHRLDLSRTIGAAPTAAAAEDKLRLALLEDDRPRPASFLLLTLGSVCFFAASLHFALCRPSRAGFTSLFPAFGIAITGAAIAVAGVLWF